MQVAGVTQYLKKVQGMPQEVETDLNKQIRKFMWNYETHNTMNQYQMYAPHEKGGKKVVDIEFQNKAIHLTWPHMAKSIPKHRRRKGNMDVLCRCPHRH